MGFRLRIVKGKSEGKEFSFTKDRVSIGRNHDNDLVIYDLNISRNHFEIVTDKNRYRVRDLGSRNGIRINDAPALDELLQEGDRIAAGGVEFEFYFSDTQPRFRVQDEGGIIEEPGSETQRMMLEQIQTHAVNLQNLGILRPAKPASTHQPDKTPPKAIGDTQRLPMRAAVRAWRRPLTYTGVGLLVCGALLAGFWSLYDRPPPDRSAEQFPLTAKADPRSFGAGRTDVATPHGAQFVFTWHGGRTLLFFTSGGIEKAGEVEVQVNGTPYALLPESGSHWGAPAELKLARANLRDGVPNLIAFVPKASDGRWGVREISLTEEALPPPSLDRARELIHLGQDAAEHKRVDPQNLFRAEDNFHRAILSLEALDEVPPEYAAAEKGYRAAHDELGKTIESGLFRAERAQRYGRTEEARSTLRELMLYLPNTTDPRRTDVATRLQRLDKK